MEDSQWNECCPKSLVGNGCHKERGGSLYQRLGGISGRDVSNRVVLCNTKPNGTISHPSLIWCLSSILPFLSTNFIYLVVALCRNHQPRNILSLQAASLQHELGHMKSFGCFLQPGIGDSRIRFRNDINEYGNSKTNRSRAYYKSEESDITEGVVDSLPSADGSAEAVLVEGNLPNATPWWQQFPRRWVIVLLCFASFLLCNMDRVSVCIYICSFSYIFPYCLFYWMRMLVGQVNMSIAILPMSQEYSWNSATVGLIQSSFFWGYLLTQV